MIDHPDIFPPIELPDDRHLAHYFSVNVYLPKELEEEYEQHAKETSPDLPFIDLHGALYLYRGSEMTEDERRADLTAAIQAGFDSGPGTEATPEFWENFKRNAAIRHEKFRALKETGRMGNLMLPEELYNFVVAKIQDGTHKTPTEVVVTALPFLKADYSKRQPSV